jgi:hypothetical protein
MHVKKTYMERVTDLVNSMGFTVNEQDIQRAYWRDRQSSSRGIYHPPPDDYHTMKYLQLNGQLKRIEHEVGNVEHSIEEQ